MTLFKSSNQIVAEIHHEFDTAQERLLQQAKLIIASADEITIDKANRLERIGFVNSETVTKVKNKQLVKSYGEAEIIEYYKQNYPFQKFLTEPELDRICKKYNLIYAPVGNYIKDVPSKNLEEIECCKTLSIKDYPTPKRLIKITDFNSNLGTDDKSKLKGWLDISDIPESDYRTLLRGMGDDILRKKFKLSTGGYVFSSARGEEILKSGLFIAAPLSHFNLKGLNRKSAFGFFNIINTEIKDPIVFRYCRGGIQVLSKWGLEGEDEILVNEKMN